MPRSARARGRWVAGVGAVVCLAAGTVAGLRPRPAAVPPASPSARSAAAAPALPRRDAPPTLASTFDGVTRIVRAAEAARTARRIAVVVYDLQPGRTRAPLFSLEPGHRFRSASIIKIGVMIAAFQLRADGKLSAERFERLRPYLNRMITVSDNPSATYLIRVLGRAQINRVLASLGLKETHLAATPRRGAALAGSTAAAGEVAHLLVRIARREIVSPAASNEMLWLLGGSEFRRRIPAGIPAHPGLWIGNKTGTVNGIAHDCAIVHDHGAGIDYTLAIFTEGVPSATVGDHLCMTLSRAVYDALLKSGKQ
jgi:beta-lactamase class A